MAVPRSDWPAARTVHLPGGCRARNGFDQTVILEPSVASGKQLTLQIPHYHDLFPSLVKVGLEPIGCDFVSHPHEAQGLVPPNWMPFYPSFSTPWPCIEEADNWTFIGQAGWANKNHALWDIARRISHQVRVCTWRLREVSQSYKDQLHAQVARGDFKVGGRFKDAFTWHGYLSMQGFFLDACVLRDYLAEFYSMYACPEPEVLRGKQVTSMGGLCKVLDKIKNPNGVTTELKDAIAEGGWLNLLGKYRDLVVHCVPLARADHSIMALNTEFSLQGGHSLAAVSLPLPDDPGSISKSRSAGKHLKALEDELSLFVEASRGSSPSTDGLQYAYASLGRLMKLVQSFRDSSPLAPEIPRLTQDDIIGEFTVVKA